MCRGQAVIVDYINIIKVEPCADNVWSAATNRVILVGGCDALT